MITSLTNPKVKYVRRLQAEKRFRLREKMFVIEGTRWLAELNRLAQPPQLVLHTETWRNSANGDQILQQLGAPIQLVSEEVMAAVSDTETPPGVLAVVPIQTFALPPEPSFLLILDAVSNPGNLGAMLRTAAAAGVDAVLLAPGCVDAYNPKVVRGGMGAHLRLPIQAMTWNRLAEAAQSTKVWLATADGDVPYTSVNWRQPSALIIGSEASGPGREAQQLAAGCTFIPMHAATESLNAAVATGILLFEAVRHRNQVAAT